MNTIEQTETQSLEFCAKSWEQRKVAARPYLHAATLLARAMGPLAQAGDHTPAALACGLVNGELRESGWCKCQRHSSANDCYYVFPDGQHGWMCSECYRVTQIG